jgi:hypothetical protein
MTEVERARGTNWKVCDVTLRSASALDIITAQGAKVENITRHVQIYRLEPQHTNKARNDAQRKSPEHITATLVL